MRKIRKRRRRAITGGNISRPYVNKRNRLILGEGKKIKKQRGGFIAPIPAAPLAHHCTLAPVAINLVSKLFR